MWKASSKTGLALLGDATDAETVSARTSADVVRHVPEIAVTLPESQGGQAVSCQWLLRPYPPAGTAHSQWVIATQDAVYVPVKGQRYEGLSQEVTRQALRPDTGAPFGGCTDQLPAHLPPGHQPASPRYYGTCWRVSRPGLTPPEGAD